MYRPISSLCTFVLLASVSGMALAEPIRYSYTLPTTPFQAVYSGKWTTFTFSGPDTATGILLPTSVKEMASSTDGFNVGIAGTNVSNVWSVNLANRTAQDIGASATPEISWTTGITFDSLRNHFYLSTLGGEGYIYTYDHLASNWSVLHSLNNVDSTAMAYSPAFDRIFVIGGGFITPLSLREYNPDTGALIRSRSIDISPIGTQLIAVDNYLALVSGSTIQAIDPVTAETWLVKVAVPELSSTVLTGAGVLCVGAVTFLARRRVPDLA